MKKQKGLRFKKEILTTLDKRIADLATNEKVQEYLKLRETDEVKEYRDLIADKKTILLSLVEDLSTIKHECNHNMVIINTENPDYIFDNYDSYHDCTCLECGKKLCINLCHSVIYKTTNFKKEDIEEVKTKYQEEYKDSKKQERIVIINSTLKNQKVKSK